MPQVSRTIISLPLGEVVEFERFQIRNRTNQGVIRRYATLIQQGVKFPPITAAKLDNKTIIVDGMHRLAAHQLLKSRSVKVKFIQCTSSQLMTTALALNSAHGHNLSRKERHEALRQLRLAHPEASNRELAKIVGIDEKTVRRFLAVEQTPRSQIKNIVQPPPEACEQLIEKAELQIRQIVNLFPESWNQLSVRISGLLLSLDPHQTLPAQETKPQTQSSNAMTNNSLAL